MTRRRPATTPLVAAAALVALLSGCDGGTDEARVDETQAAASTPSASSTPTPSASPTPSVAGRPATAGSLTVVLPEDDDWKVQQYQDTGVSSYQRTQPPGGRVAVIDVTNVADEDLDVNATTWMGVLTKSGYELQRLPDREVAGVTGWVLRGKDDLGMDYYEYGTVRDSRFVRVEAQWYSELDPGDFLADVVEPVLATAQWS
jgi:hypothetical protein